MQKVSLSSKYLFIFMSLKVLGLRSLDIITRPLARQNITVWGACSSHCDKMARDRMRVGTPNRPFTVTPTVLSFLQLGSVPSSLTILTTFSGDISEPSHNGSMGCTNWDVNALYWTVVPLLPQFLAILLLDRGHFSLISSVPREWYLRVVLN